ncbi:hypothetical protein K8R43_00230 [archaeon]|nr:hypothetical protein [archaeon]
MRVGIFLLALIVLTALAVAEHDHSVFFFPEAINSNGYAPFYIRISNQEYSDHEINQIVLEIPTSSNESDFKIDSQSVLDGIPLQGYVNTWFVPSSLSEYDEDNYYSKITYVANTPFQLMPDDSIAFTFYALVPEEVGSYKFYVTTVDSDGEEESTGIDVIIDYQKPIPLISGAPSEWKRTKTRARMTCSDEGDPASGCNYSSYGFYLSDEPTCPSDYSLYTNGRTITVNQHSWVCAVAMDNAFNIGFSGPVEFKIDNSKPRTVIQMPAPGSWEEQEFFVTIVYADEVRSGLEICYYRIGRDWKSFSCTGDVGAITVKAECSKEGENTCKVEAYAVDKAGNKGETVVGYYSIDASKPKAEILSIIPSTEINEDIYLNGVVEVFTNSSDMSLESQFLYASETLGSTKENELIAAWDTRHESDGLQTLVLIARDELANLKRTELDVIIDNTPPKTTLKKEELISFEAMDNGSGIDAIYYRIGGNWEYYVEPFKAKAGILEYYSIDRLGNKESIKKEVIPEDSSITAVTGRLISRVEWNLPTIIILLIILIGSLRIFYLLYRIKQS